MSTSYPSGGVEGVQRQIRSYIAHHRFMYDQMKKRGMGAKIPEPLHSRVEAATLPFLEFCKEKADESSWKEIHKMIESTRIGLCETTGYRLHFIDHDMILLKTDLFLYKLESCSVSNFSDGNEDDYFRQNVFLHLKRYPGARSETEEEKKVPHKALREQENNIPVQVSYDTKF